MASSYGVAVISLACSFDGAISSNLNRSAVSSFGVSRNQHDKSLVVCFIFNFFSISIDLHLFPLCADVTTTYLATRDYCIYNFTCKTHASSEP
jgi:hypothetical protein